MSPINGIRSQSFGIHTRANLGRTSSNTTMPEQFRVGLKNGLDVTSSALRSIPGGAVLSRSLSDAAINIAPPTTLNDPSSIINTGVDGTFESLPSDFVKNGTDMLKKQLEIAEYTTELSSKSNIIKAVADTKRGIIQNFR